MPSRVKRKGNAPHTAIGIEPEFLHICVLRSFERVNQGPFRLRPEHGKPFGSGEQFDFHCLRHLYDLRCKQIVIVDHPSQSARYIVPI